MKIKATERFEIQIGNQVKIYEVGEQIEVIGKSKGVYVLQDGTVKFSVVGSLENALPVLKIIPFIGE